MVKTAGKGSKGSPSRGGGRGQGGRGLSNPIAGRGGSSTPLRQSPRRGSSTPFRCRSPGTSRRPLSLGAPSRMPASGIVEGRGTAAVGVAGNNYNVAGSGSNTNLSSSTICPICGRDLRHPKALYGHMRWHSTGTPAGDDQEVGNEDVEVQTSATTTASTTVLAGPAVPENDREEGEIVEGDIGNKAFVLPDLNLSPPPEDE